MILPLNGDISIIEISFDKEDNLVIKTFNEKESYEFCFKKVLRFFFYKDKEKLRFRMVENEEKIKRYEEKYWNGTVQYNFNLYQLVNEANEICIEILSQSHEIFSKGKI